VTALRALVRSDYTWTIAGVERLLKPPRQRPGPKPKYDWGAIDAEITRRCTTPRSKRPRLPANQSEFAREMLEWCGKRLKGAEPTDSAMRNAIKRVCKLPEL
jgi:hypothetical protein